MKILNNKLLLELRPDNEQDSKDFLNPRADVLKLYKVIQKGCEVSSEIQEGDLVKCFVNNVVMLDTSSGFVSDRDIIFVNSYPRDGKVQITNSSNLNFSLLKTAEVIKSSYEELDKGDIVYLNQNTSSLVLPDSTEIVSKNQLYAKK